MTFHDQWETSMYFSPPFNVRADEIAPGSVRLRWKRNQEPYLTGYKLFYARWDDVKHRSTPDNRHDPYTGTRAVQGASPIKIWKTELLDQNHPEVVLSGLAYDTKYVFCVTGTSPWIYESFFSAEVHLTTSPAPPKGEPGVLLAGWWDTDLRHGQAGVLRLAAIGNQEAQSVSLTAPSGLARIELPATGGGMHFLEVAIPADTASNANQPITDEVRALLPLAAASANGRESVAWPYLIVE